MKEYVSKPFEEKYKTDKKNKPLEQRIERYEEKLRELNIEPENLSLTEHSFWFVVRYFFLRLYLILFFSPLSAVGAILHFPAYQLCRFSAERKTHHGVDDIVSTVKILGGDGFYAFDVAYSGNCFVFQLGLGSRAYFDSGLRLSAVTPRFVRGKNSKICAAGFAPFNYFI